MAQRLLRIGEVAERTGLSLRTIRHYEEVGVIGRTERSDGGFRLCTEAEERRLKPVARLRKYWQETDARCEDLRRELAAAEDFARSLHGRLARLTAVSPDRPVGGAAR